MTSYDITDLSNPTELDRYRTDPGQQSSPHNAHFLNDYLFVSYYQDGLVILDVTQPRSLSRVAQFDTHPGSGGEFDGCWGAYPYLPSGNILVTDVQSGLYILDFQETRAAYVQGTVKANIDGNPPVWNPLVNVLNSPEETYGDLSGNFAFALSPGGIYDLQVSHPFYESKTIPVNLTAGEVENLTILLDPLVDGVEEARESGFTLFPNPAQTTEAIIIQGPELPQNVHLLDALGRIQATAQPTLSGALIWNKQPAAGTYWIVLNFQNGDAIQQQLILLD